MRILFMMLITTLTLEASEGAKDGDTVKLHYIGTLKDGKVFDSSEGRDPLNFKLGEGQVVPGFENAIRGMRVGETKKVLIKAEDAYGAYDPELIQNVERKNISKEGNLKPGAKLIAYSTEGTPQMFTVVECYKDHIKIDGNHPMAGKDLNFEIRLLEINKGE